MLMCQHAMHTYPNYAHKYVQILLAQKSHRASALRIKHHKAHAKHKQILNECKKKEEEKE